MRKPTIGVAALLAASCALGASWNVGAPRVTGPRLFGATPNRDFRYAFPVCGSRDVLTLSVPPHACRVFLLK